MMRKYITGLPLAASICDTGQAAETWVCGYSDQNTDYASSMTLVVNGDKLTGALTDTGITRGFTVLENNDFAVIGASHEVHRAPNGTVEIIAAVVMIDRAFGRFIYTSGVMSEEKRVKANSAVGSCLKR
jgi:hypothetical protein